MVKQLVPMDENTYLRDDIKDWFNRRKYRRNLWRVVRLLLTLGLIAWAVIEFG